MNPNAVKFCLVVNGCLLAIAAALLLAHGPGVHVLVSLGLAALGIVSGLVAPCTRRYRNRGAR
jgi:hypothetical protein